MIIIYKSPKSVTAWKESNKSVTMGNRGNKRYYDVSYSISFKINNLHFWHADCPMFIAGDGLPVG